MVGGRQRSRERTAPDLSKDAETEVTIPAPEAGRIYLFDTTNFDVAYEIRCPQVPDRFYPKILTISKPGVIELMTIRSFA